MPNATAWPVLVVGSGFGCRVHVPALRAAGLHVAGLIGADAARTAKRAAAADIPAAFTNLDEAITSTKAVAVTIASPPHLHAPHALTAIARGCHVICEKPMALDATEAAAMLAAAQNAGVTHLMGHEFRWQPDRAIIGRAIAQGRIGTPRLVTLHQSIPLVASPDARMPEWWFDPASGGGWLGASGSHVIDQLRAWLGEIASLSASLPMVSARTGAEDSYVVRLRTTSGAEAILVQTAGAWGPMSATTRISGTQGTLWLEAGAVHLADATGTRELPTPGDLILPPMPPGIAESRGRPNIELPPFIRLCEALRAGIEGKLGTSPVPIPTFADGLACMRILDAIRASAAADGALVTL